MNDNTEYAADTALVIDCREVTRTYNEGPEKLTIFSDISLRVSACRQNHPVEPAGRSGSPVIRPHFHL